MKTKKQMVVTIGPFHRTLKKGQAGQGDIVYKRKSQKCREEKELYQLGRFQVRHVRAGVHPDLD